MLRFILVAPFRFWYVTLVVAVAAFVYWQWLVIYSWVFDTTEAILSLFGLGLVLLVLAAGALFLVIWRRRLSAVLRHWNVAFGVIAFLLAAWGILAFFPGEGMLRRAGLGGTTGLSIIGYPSPYFLGTLVASLRLLWLVVVGVVLVAPGFVRRLGAGLISRLRRQWRQRTLSVPGRKLSLPAPVIRKPPQSRQASEPVSPVVPPSPLVVTAPARKELRQVAQDVWKKYGESPDLVTVDGWRLPPVDILDTSPEVQFSQADNERRARLIEEAIASYGVEAKVVQINAGPTVTQFGIEPGWDRRIKEVREKDRDGKVQFRQEEISRTRVKVDKITSLANDLSLALAAPSIRIEAPVPGKSIIGVEVPNTVSSMVSLRGVIETSVFQKLLTRSKLSLALGTGAGGEAVVADLARMPHLLIAGATGSGKTVCLNTIICGLLLNNTPNDLRFVMIDPKRVELATFNSIPHLATPVIVDTEKALEVMRWLSREMDKRYQTLAAASARNIDGYNKTREGEEKMPYLVLVIDELADLMMTVGDEVEHILCRLAQLARAVGIHLVVATQRPSVDVITGLIKANFPTRISFAVTSLVDSRTILDGAGAEKLLGRGDMLFLPTEAAKPKRLQGCFVSDAEAERLVYFWGSQRKEDTAILRVEDLKPSPPTARRVGSAEDSLLAAARQLAKDHDNVSTSFLQRRLRIGYPRAARIMEQLQEDGLDDDVDAAEDFGGPA